MLIFQVEENTSKKDSNFTFQFFLQLQNDTKRRGLNFPNAHQIKLHKLKAGLQAVVQKRKSTAEVDKTGVKQLHLDQCLKLQMKNITQRR